VAARKTVGEMTHVLVGNWRVGRKVPLNVYEGDRPVCQCHSEQDATRIMEAMNRTQPQWINVEDELPPIVHEYWLGGLSGKLYAESVNVLVMTIEGRMHMEKNSM
jgi:hypothetical protein